MEVTLEETTRFEILKVCAGFNPYSNGSYFGSQKVYPPLLRGLLVSILILMEVTLEVDDLNTKDDFLQGFNPYSNGSYFGSSIFMYTT